MRRLSDWFGGLDGCPRFRNFPLGELRFGKGDERKYFIVGCPVCSKLNGGGPRQFFSAIRRAFFDEHGGEIGTDECRLTRVADGFVDAQGLFEPSPGLWEVALKKKDAAEFADVLRDARLVVDLTREQQRLLEHPASGREFVLVFEEQTEIEQRLRRAASVSDVSTDGEYFVVQRARLRQLTLLLQDDCNPIQVVGRTDSVTDFAPDFERVGQQALRHLKIVLHVPDPPEVGQGLGHDGSVSRGPPNLERAIERLFGLPKLPALPGDLALADERAGLAEMVARGREYRLRRLVRARRRSRDEDVPLSSDGFGSQDVRDEEVLPAKLYPIWEGR